MARTYFCPRCLDEISPDAVGYWTRDGQRTEKPVIRHDRGPLQWSRALWHGDPRPLYHRDPKAQAEAYQLGIHARCPHQHPMPPLAFEIPSVVVGAIGEKSAGKTVYLATLLEQLDRGRLLPYLAFTAQEQTERVAEELFGEFYRSGTPPFGTGPGREERFREALTLTASGDGRDRFYLSFFDASGEQLRLADHGETNRFLFVADVVLHFLTPEGLGLARRRPERRGDQLQSWRLTNKAVQAATTVAKAKSTLTHAVVIVPKSDDLDPDAIDMLRDARAELDYGRGLSLLRAHRIIEDDSHYIRDVIRGSDDGRVLSDTIENAYASTSYHLVSATGEPLDERYGRFVRRRPQRVIDPLLSALVRVGVLDVGQGRRAFG